MCVFFSGRGVRRAAVDLGPPSDVGVVERGPGARRRKDFGGWKTRGDGCFPVVGFFVWRGLVGTSGFETTVLMAGGR